MASEIFPNSPRKDILGKYATKVLSGETSDVFFTRTNHVIWC